MAGVIGGVLLLIGAWGVSRAMGSREMQRVAEYEAILDFLRYIRMQIDCFRTPRGELFGKYQNKCLLENGFLEALTREGTIEGALQEAHGLWEREDCLVLQCFDRELGDRYLEEQLASCDYYIALWETRVGAVKEGLGNRIKLKRTLALSLGALIWILLI